eukprot:scaffold25469_cov131-Isochrysis_galbana.AAC.3
MEHLLKRRLFPLLERRPVGLFKGSVNTGARHHLDGIGARRLKVCRAKCPAPPCGSRQRWRITAHASYPAREPSS